MIKLQERLELNDALKYINRKKKSPFIGLVKIFENGRLITDKDKNNINGFIPNVVVGGGREFAAQRLFSINPTITILDDLTDYKIDSFGVGSGGSIFDSTNTFLLTSPDVCDYKLQTPVELNTSCLTTREGNDYIVKKITSEGLGGRFGSIELLKSSSPEYTLLDEEYPIYLNCPDYNVIVKCACVIDVGEPHYLLPGESFKMDEAMLFSTSISNPTATPFPFSHVTFAPKFVEKESAYVIEWYIIF